MATHEQLLTRVKALTILVKSQGDAHLAIQSLAQETLKDPKYRGVLQDALEDADHPHKEYHRDPHTGESDPVKDQALVQSLATPERGDAHMHYHAARADELMDSLDDNEHQIGIGHRTKLHESLDGHHLGKYVGGNAGDDVIDFVEGDRLNSVAAYLSGRKPNRMFDRVVFKTPTGVQHGYIRSPRPDRNGTVVVRHGNYNPTPGSNIQRSIVKIDDLLHEAEHFHKNHQGAQE